MLSAALTASLALSLKPAAPPLRTHLHRNSIVHSFQTLFTVGKIGLLNTKIGFDVVSKFGHIVLLLVFLLLVCLPVLFYLGDCVFLLLFFYLYFLSVITGLPLFI